MNKKDTSRIDDSMSGLQKSPGLVLSLLAACISVLLAFSQQNTESSRRQEISGTFTAEWPAHFGVVEAWSDYQESQNIGFEIVRRFIRWGRIEPQRGTFDWSWLDYDVSMIHKYGFDILLILIPFADWDQDLCRPGANLNGPPCDIEAYKAFVRAIVERYDGDGFSDMPGLARGIHFWEIFNEPALPAGIEGYDVPVEAYLELLKATYPIIKERCPSCEALQGGEAGVTAETVNYIEKYLSLGAANYFDIANVHFIHATFFDETLFAEPFTGLLARHQIKKPVWITEVQVQGGPGAADPFFTEEQAASEMVKAYVRAFAIGIERIFYTVVKENPLFPAIMNKAALIDGAGRRRPAYYAMKTMISQLKAFESVKVLTPGAYKFNTPGRPTYVLWGSGAAPSEIAGVVKIVGIDGIPVIRSASSIALSRDPIFVTMMSRRR